MQDEFFEHKFLLRHHFWFDSGLPGLYSIAVLVKGKNAAYSDISFQLESDGMTFKAGSKEEFIQFLSDCYEELADRYWNVSTKKQREAKDLVIYYKEKDELGLIPRRNPTPLPALFTKGSSFRADAEEFEKLSPEMQQRVKAFLDEHKKTLWGKKKKLLFEPPVCHPKIKLFPSKGKKTTCCICGSEDVCDDVSQPSFLLFASPTAALSFNSEGKKPDKLCWECEFLSKFAIESALYKTTDENLFILQLNTGHAEKLVESHRIIGSQSAVRQIDNDYFMSNIGTEKGDRLLYYARLPYELLWAFFHDTYFLLRTEAEARTTSKEELFMFCIKPFIETPIQLILMMISQKGQTFIPKEIIAYTETAYAFRLLHSMREEFSNDQKFLFKVYQDLYLPSEGKFDISNNLLRNRILQKVLKKQPILQEVEQWAFRKSLKQNYPYIGNVLNFTRHYQQIIFKEGCELDKEQVEVAVNLGKQIVLSAKETSDTNFDRVKGDLFALRKTRTKTDFLEQLSRIQSRYNIIVSNKILSGILEEKDFPFTDFKSYCLLGALNTYNNIKRPKKSEE
ncbi:MAG TPA: hypothetical protein GX691_03085 [Clostridia bacterium]|nr:hypothetical protein [Clostridia bacterium]